MIKILLNNALNNKTCDTGRVYLIDKWSCLQKLTDGKLYMINAHSDKL